MKILYAVQATGNGHIARANQILPILNKYADVDVFLSGNNYQLPLENVKYKSKGLSFFYNQSGGLNYKKTLSQINPIRLLQEVNGLPVNDYDLVLNDFEALSAWACYFKNVPCISFGHQAAFVSEKTPRPEKISKLGEILLKYYAPSAYNLGLHFKAYEDFIFTPVIKKQLHECAPQNKGHITVYLSAFSEEEIVRWATSINYFRWEIFSKTCKRITSKSHITIYPTDSDMFTKSMINAHGVITGAGFETPAEVLHLGKKLLIIPILGQYEQLCNATAMNELGVDCINDYNKIPQQIEEWLHQSNIVKMNYQNNIEMLIEKIFSIYERTHEADYEGISLIR